MEEEKKEVEENLTNVDAIPSSTEPVDKALEVVNTEEKEVIQPKKKKPILLIVLLLILLVAVIVLLIIFKPFDSKKNDKKVIDTPKEIKSDYRMTGNSISAFDLYFLKLENNEKNSVYSPLSIKYALEMLSEGAKGDTKAQLDAVIGDYKIKKYENNSNMSFANAFFVRNRFKDAVKQTYIDTLTNKYNAEIKYDSFENASTINDWVSSKTFNLIKDLLKDSNVIDKEFILVNALGIDMKWNYLIHCAMYKEKNDVPCYGDGAYYVQYQHEKLQGSESEYEVISYPYTGDENFPSLTFDGKDNKKSVEIFADFNRYDIIKEIGEEKIRDEVTKAHEEWLNSDEAKEMKERTDVYEDDFNIDNYINELKSNYGKESKSTDYMIYYDDNVKVFSKDLQSSNGTTLQYVGIMPRTVSLKSFIETSTAQSIQQLIDSTKELKIENFTPGYVTEVYGKIPLFKYEFELNLKSDLMKLGITDVFELGKANLGNMLNDAKGMFIGEAKHKANIEFSNEGIKAAAATEEGGLGNANWGFNYLYEVPTIKIDMTFDKPYLYLIRDKNTDEVWFVGTVYDPINK